MDEITGNVHLTHNLSLGPFESAIVSGLLKGPVKNSAYYKRVNVSVEPMSSHLNDDSKYCAIPGYTFLKPGSHRIHVMMKNLTARTVTIHQGVKVATMSAANVVPHMLAPEEVKVQTPPVKPETNTKVPMKSASVVGGMGKATPSREIHEAAPSRHHIDRAPSRKNPKSTELR